MFGSRFSQRAARAAAGKARLMSSLSGRSATKTAVLVASAATASVGVAYFLYKYQYDIHEASAGSKAALDPQAFKAFKLSKIIDVNHNSKIFRFDLEDPEQVLGMPVASAILVRAPGEDGKPVVRPYTPLAGDDKGHMDLLVKRYETGKMSKHIHDLKIGDALEVKGPLPKIQYAPNKWKKIGMIAGGTGLTPMLQVAHEILKNPADKTEVSFVFANIAEEDILLRKQLDDMAKKHSNFKVHYVLEKPPKGWNGSVGYVTEDIVKKHMPSPSSDSIVFVCGPPPMVAAISGPKAPDYTQGEVDGILKKLNYTKEHVFKF